LNILVMLEPIRLEGIIVSILCGLVVGLERQLSQKPTGIRTSILICLGTYIFVAGGHLIQSGNSDPGRIVGQIVTGIGFIGAGVIMTRQGLVIGVTSASVIWVLAGIGIFIGLERYMAAVLLSILTVGVLVGVNALEKTFVHLRKGIYSRFVSRMHKTSPSSEGGTSNMAPDNKKEDF
jgi:putative Mg2+ transporter-C (MgtC) family protein